MKTVSGWLFSSRVDRLGQPNWLGQPNQNLGKKCADWIKKNEENDMSFFSICENNTSFYQGRSCCFLKKNDTSFIKEPIAIFSLKWHVVYEKWHVIFRAEKLKKKLNFSENHKWVFLLQIFCKLGFFIYLWKFGFFFLIFFFIFYRNFHKFGVIIRIFWISSTFLYVLNNLGILYNASNTFELVLCIFRWISFMHNIEFCVYYMNLFNAYIIFVN